MRFLKMALLAVFVSIFFMPSFVNFFYCFQPYKSLKPVDSMTEAEL